MKRLFPPAVFLIAAVLCIGCGTSREQDPPYAPHAPAAEEAASVIEADSADPNQPEETIVNKHIILYINETEIPVLWEDNRSVEALLERISSAPLTVRMSRYGGFEQVGSLDTGLPRDESRITTQPGDIVLYSGDQIVLFYGSNTWSYTRLGKITGKSETELAELLGSGDITVTLSVG